MDQCLFLALFFLQSQRKHDIYSLLSKRNSYPCIHNSLEFAFNMPEKLCEEEHFKSVFYQFAEKLRNFVFYKSGDMDLAEDLVQEAFGKLWENCKKVSFEKAQSYLYTVANNKFLNLVAHKKVVLNFEKRPHRQLDDQDPQFQMEEQEFLLQLEKAIASLPEDQRLVFLMNRIDKKKYREIAESLDISIKTVESRMHKALNSLRKIHKNV